MVFLEHRKANMHRLHLPDEECAIPPPGPIPQVHPAGHGKGVSIAQAMDMAQSMQFRAYDDVAQNEEEMELGEVFYDAEG
jgi:hypothetical protein